MRKRRPADDARGMVGGQGRRYPDGKAMARYERKDAVYRKARGAGLRSRASVKLEEIDQRHRILNRGQRVVDLGAWPGGWLQIAARRVGDEGIVIGVDLEEIEPLDLRCVRTFVGDILDPTARVRIRDELGGPADVVLSDMAPKITGVKVTDRARHMALIEAAVECATEILRPGGKFVAKLFSGIESDAIRLLRERFETVSRFRPDSTRKGSAEIYAIAISPRVSGED